jgi:hypothetical protein
LIGANAPMSEKFVLHAASLGLEAKAREVKVVDGLVGVERQANREQVDGKESENGENRRLQGV